MISICSIEFDLLVFDFVRLPNSIELSSIEFDFPERSIYCAGFVLSMVRVNQIISQYMSCRNIV